MVRFTFLEVNLDGAEFNAKAPFSGETAEKADEGAGSSIGTEFGEERGSAESGTRTLGVIAGLVALVGGAAVARKLLSRGRSDDAATESESPLLAG